MHSVAEYIRTAEEHIKLNYVLIDFEKLCKNLIGEIAC